MEAKSRRYQGHERNSGTVRFREATGSLNTCEVQILTRTTDYEKTGKRWKSVTKRDDDKAGRPVRWSKDKTVTVFRKLARNHRLNGVMPSQQTLVRWAGPGGRGLLDAIVRLWGSWTAFAHAQGLITVMEHRRGVPLMQPKFEITTSGKVTCSGCHWRRDGRDVCVLPRCFARMGG